jgi:hypothetical protein
MNVEAFLRGGLTLEPSRAKKEVMFLLDWYDEQQRVMKRQLKQLSVEEMCQA